MARKAQLTHDQKLSAAVGQVIHERRERLGFTQSGFARAKGFQRVYIGEVERGKRSLAIRNVCRLAEALGMTASKVLKKAEQKLEKEAKAKKAR